MRNRARKGLKALRVAISNIRLGRFAFVQKAGCSLIGYRYIFLNKIGKNRLAFNIDKAACDELRFTLPIKT
jgi:hypothetical protein